MNVLQWADFYPKVPTAVQTGNGPDIAIMHIDQLATNAARQVIIPLDPVAEPPRTVRRATSTPRSGRPASTRSNRYGIPLDTHPLLFYYNKKSLQQAGVDTPPADKASFEAAVKAHEGQGCRGPLLGYLDLAGPPDVVDADPPVRRYPRQRRRHPGPVQLRRRRARP